MNIKKEDHFNYIVMWSGKEGLGMFNTWGLDETQCADPTNIWTRKCGQKRSSNHSDRTILCPLKILCYDANQKDPNVCSKVRQC